MATLATQSPTPTGTVAAFVAASAGGDKIAPGERVFLHVKAGATPATVTVDAVRACDQGFDHDLSVVVAANTERLIGPIGDRFKQLADGYANVTYSQVATITVAVIRVA